MSGGVSFFATDSAWFLAAGLFSLCSLTLLLIGWQEYRASLNREPVTEQDAASNSRPLSSTVERGVTR